MKNLLLEIFSRTKGIVVFDETTKFNDGRYGFDNRIRVDPRCPLASLLDKATRSEKLKIFRWIFTTPAAENPITWEGFLQIAKSFCKDGSLVKEEGEAFLFSRIERGDYLGIAAFASFLGSSRCYEKDVVKALQFIPVDSRDAIFMAAYNLNTSSIYNRLLNLFDKFTDDDWHEAACCTGELLWAEYFLRLWEKTPGYVDHRRKHWISTILQLDTRFAKTKLGIKLAEGL